MGELSTQLEKSKHAKGLKFPLILFSSSSTFFFLQKSTETDGTSKWRPPGLLARVLCPFVLFLLSLKEAHKLCQLFVTSRAIMLFLSRLSGQAKRRIL